MPEDAFGAAAETTEALSASRRPDAHINGHASTDDTTTSENHDNELNGHIVAGPANEQANGDRLSTPDTAVRKRKFDSVSKSGRGPRGTSPPWRKVAAEGPSSFLVDGKRKSARQSLAGQPDSPGSAPATKKIKNESPPWKNVAVEGPTAVVIDGHRKSTRINTNFSEAQPSPQTRPVGKGQKISPPWKQAAADGPSSFVVDGQRKSARRSTLLPQSDSPLQKQSGNHLNGHKRKLSSVASLHGGAVTREAELTNHRKVRSEVKQEVTMSPPKRGPGRPPKNRASHITTDELVQPGVNGESSPIVAKIRHRRSNSRRDDIHSRVQDSKLLSQPLLSPSQSYPRLKLRFKLPGLPKSNPLHYPREAQHGSLGNWLQKDDPFAGEDLERPTEEKSRKEAQDRLRIALAMEEGGALDSQRSSLFLPDGFKEPRPRYGHQSFVASHAMNMQKLMRQERERHRRSAKMLAQGCQQAVNLFPRWAFLLEKKTDEQIWEELTVHQRQRYTQLMRDLSRRWVLVRAEVERIRLKRWEEEQERLGQKAMDDILEQSTAMLKFHPHQESSAAGSQYDEGEESAGSYSGSDTGDGETWNDGPKNHDEDDENMTESSDDSNEEQDETGQEDDDANLSPEALRKKYAGLLMTKRLPTPETERSQSDDTDSDGAGSDDDSRMSSPHDQSRQASTDPSTPTDEAQTSIQDTSPLSAQTSDSKVVLHQNSTSFEKVVEYNPPELEEVDSALLESDEEASTDMSSDMGSDDEDDGWDADSSGSENGEEDDEDEGMENSILGFFSKKQLQKARAEAEASSPVRETAVASAQEPLDTEIGLGSPREVNGEEAATEDAGTSPRIFDASSNADENGQLSTSQSTPQTPRSEASAMLSSRQHHKTEIPSQLLRGTLREYQHDGLDWLTTLYTSGRNGILADEMGLGKTIQTISLLAYLAVHHEAWGPHLVVVPTSVMLNWEMEFKKWCPGFKILTYYGTQEERKRKRQGWLDDTKWNVCITSYQLILQDAAAFKKRSWHYLILDEAHNIKNFQTQRWQTLLTFKTHSRLLLTGTPLQNNLQELWSLLYFLMPAGTDGAGGFADLEKFLFSLKKPADQILDQGRQQLDAEAQARVSKLHEVLRPYLLRRLKSEVEKQMPGKYEHVITCRLSKRQRQLYDEFMGRADTKKTLASGNYMSIINCLMSLRKVCNHPDLFETRQIVTSLAMQKSAVADYEIKELLVRRRLLAQQDLDLDYCGLLPASYETDSRRRATRIHNLNPIRKLTKALQNLGDVRMVREKGEAPNQVANSGIKEIEEIGVMHSLRNVVNHTSRVTQRWPIYGADLVRLLTLSVVSRAKPSSKKQQLNSRSPGEWALEQHHLIQSMKPSLPQVAKQAEVLVRTFSCVTPAVVAEDVLGHTLTRRGQALVAAAKAREPSDPYHEARIRSSIQFPDKRLLQYDCGKLQALDKLLRNLQAGGHRCLIFTQMTKVLDILEQFLNIHGHRYLRLDGATKVEQRQILTDRFNSDKRILAFILSSRSGGLGINLTGADTVIFYDLDWNPAMDAQCQDRCHRIGQTRDVHIYRFVSEYTIEANILRKSNQKRLLDDVIIQKGDFTTQTFNRITYKDAFNDEDYGDDNEASQAMDRILGRGDEMGIGKAFEGAEDKEDALAAKVAAKEMVVVDAADFNEKAAAKAAAADLADGSHDKDAITAVDDAMTTAAAVIELEDNEEELPHVDEYMIRFLLDELKNVVVEPPGLAASRKRNKKGKDWRRR